MPLAPHPPPPPSFLSLVQHHRRRSSQTKGRPRFSPRKSKPWPPDRYPRRTLVPEDEAHRLIARGASAFAGHAEKVTHAEDQYRFFAVMEDERSSRSDRAPFQDPAFEMCTLSLTGPADGALPWLSLEQPSMASAYGKSPGTTTLTYYVGKAGCLQPPVSFGSKRKAKKMKLIAILERLAHLENQGIEDITIEETYSFLYERLIEDPAASTDPHYDRAMQIADLLTVLSNPEWIDFSVPRNQVVAKFFDSRDERVKRRFFHQLLLATELHLRIESPEHDAAAKKRLLKQVPPKVAWDLALAQRWLEHMSIARSHLSDTQSTFTFTLNSKKAQKESLWKFAFLLKWPNMDELEYILAERDEEEKGIEDRSADAMSWFTGVILPGPTLPWLLMNTLIDCDRDTGDELNQLTHMFPNSGFQYRANTYWSCQCIVGKVLGAGRGVRQVAGWIGPCHYAPELERTRCVIVRQQEPRYKRLSVEDVESIGDRTRPLGPSDQEYALDEFHVLEFPSDGVDDLIRIQKLSFHPHRVDDNTGRLKHDAAIIFAFAQQTMSFKLRHNVDFIHALPCVDGPHPLHYSYTYKIARVADNLTDVHGWGNVNGLSKSSRRSRTTSPAGSGLRSRSQSDSLALARSPDSFSEAGHARYESQSPDLQAHTSIREVLLVEACGVSDNEVFARAWCAHWGVSAIVANLKETCAACAIREAYAACVSVVVLTEGGRAGEEDEMGSGHVED